MKEAIVARLFCEFNATGFNILDEEGLRKQVKNLRDAYESGLTRLLNTLKTPKVKLDPYTML